MGNIRFLYRLVLFFIWTLIMAVYGAVVGIGSNGVKRLTVGAKIWTTGAAKIFGLRIKIYGDPGKISGLIISNHLSYIDIFLLGAIFPLRYTPKSDVRKWPFLGWFFALSKPIWIDRTTKQKSIDTLNEIVKSIKDNINIISFPEGTTTDGKNGILPFKSTIFEAAIKGDVPVNPIIVHYKEDDKIMVSWYGDYTLLGHAWRLLKASMIEAEIHILEPIKLTNVDRKYFANYVWELMNTKYKELYN